MKKLLSSIVMVLAAVCAFAQTTALAISSDHAILDVSTGGTQTYEHVGLYDSNKDILTVNCVALASYILTEKPTWGTYSSTSVKAGNENGYVEAPEPFQGVSAYGPSASAKQFLNVSTLRPLTIRVTNCSKVAALMRTSTTNASGKATMQVYEVESGAHLATPTFEGSAEKTDAGVATVLECDGLDASKTYDVILTASGNQNARAFEMAFYKGSTGGGEEGGGEGGGEQGGGDEPSTKELVAQWTPDTAYLDHPDSIKLTLNTKGAISFKGMKFDYLNASDNFKSETIELAKIATKDTLDGGIEYRVAAPTQLKNNKAMNVRVSLVGQENLDGQERDSLSTTYNQMSLKIIAPMALTAAKALQIDTLKGNDSIKVQLPVELHERIGVVYYFIKNTTTGVTEHSGYITKGFAQDAADDYAKGIWGSDFIQDQTFYEGNTYSISAFALMSDQQYSTKIPAGRYLAADSITGIEGTAETYKYSTVKHVSTTPSDKTFIIEQPEDAVITMTFDGLVKVDQDNSNIITGSNSTYDFTKIYPVDEEGNETNDAYSKTWKLDGSGYIKAYPAVAMQTSIIVVDEKGLHVEGNAGFEDTSNFYYGFENAYGAPTSTLTPANNATVDVLDTIIVDNSLGLGLAYRVKDEKFTLTDENGNVVAIAADCISNDTKTAQDKSPKSVKIALSKKIKKAGRYVLDIPYSYFILGSDNYTYYGGHQTDTIFVSGNADYPMVETITPDTTAVNEGATEKLIESLSTITLTFDEAVEVNTENEEAITVSNAQSKATYDHTVALSADGKTVTITLSEAILADEAAKKYIGVTIPAGYFVTAEGTKSALVNAYFTVGKAAAPGTETENVTANPASGSTVKSLQTIKLTFTDHEFVAAGSDYDIKATVSKDNEVISTFTAARLDFDFDDPTNVLILTLPSEITSEGTYTLAFPEGFVLTGEYGDSNAKAFQLTYTVASTTGISTIASKASADKTVYTLSGQKATKAQKGLYIIGGKKVVVK